MQKMYPYYTRRRFVLFVVCLALLATFWPLRAFADSVGVATDDIILRTSASTSSVPLATIRKGSEITLIVKEGEWYKAKTGTLTGYVMAKFISVQDAPKAEKSAEAGDATASSVLERGSKGDDVARLQKNLRTLGFFEEEATGNFGELTESAVKAFQSANGLTADGRAGAATQDKLSAKASSGGSTGALKRGSEGDDVRALQKKLQQLGYFTEDVTGYYGIKTEAAVMAYQGAAGIAADGVAGMGTLEKLRSANAQSPSDALRKGDAGNGVQELQRLLKSAGYYNGSVDGNFGEGTFAALTSYQKAVGLSADGVAGKQTLQKLSSGVGGNSAPSNVGSTPVITVKNNNNGDFLAGNTTGIETPANNAGNSSAPSIAPSQSNGSLKMVDWWSGEINLKYARKGLATMVDVWTGKSLTIYRFGGTNHLDWEPATAADTAILREITGGSWSWSARPCILITPDGTRYAGATNTMPHGQYHLTDNDFPGQCCMHFVNSWTHAKNQINQDMQGQIVAAFNSGK